MSIDPKGTQPGIIPTAPKPKVVNLKCRMDGCGSVEAIEISPAPQSENAGAPLQRMYQCTQCQGTWGLPVGGHFPF